MGYGPPGYLGKKIKVASLRSQSFQNVLMDMTLFVTGSCCFKQHGEE